jgi:hypothetical protein
MKKELYVVFRSLFGLYIIWMGLINLEKIEMNQGLVKQSVDNFEASFDLEGILNFLNLQKHLPIHEIRKYSFNTDNLKDSSNELVYAMNISLIIGGILCFFGYRISFSFILVGLVLDLIFIHNYFYFRDEKMKVNVLKLLSILGGAFQIA